MVRVAPAAAAASAQPGMVWPSMQPIGDFGQAPRPHRRRCLLAMTDLQEVLEYGLSPLFASFNDQGSSTYSNEDCGGLVAFFRQLRNNYHPPPAWPPQAGLL